jgi:hypothetical protein
MKRSREALIADPRVLGLSGLLHKVRCAKAQFNALAMHFAHATYPAKL